MQRNIFSLIIIFLFAINASYSQYFVTTYSGVSTAGFVNGHVDSSTFNSPFGMCIDKNGNLYIADAGNNCIRKINTLTGIVTTLAGTGVAGWHDGPGDSAMFNSPSDLCVDDSGNVYVSDFLNQRIRKINSSGVTTTIAGNGTAGLINSIHTLARFNYPRGICRDSIGNLYIGDSWNHRIRKIDTSGVVSTYAGGGTSIGVGTTGSLVDGVDSLARFFTPSGLTIDASGNVYVADAYNHRIRKIDTTGYVTTIAGSGPIGMGNGGYLNGDTSIALLNTPTEMFLDTSTNELYISDTFNNRIRKLNMTTGMINTFAGSGFAAFTDTVDTLAAFNYTRGIVVSEITTKKVFVNDYNNNSIRQIEYINIAGLNEGMIDEKIIIMSNPFDSMCTISLLSDRYNHLKIYDVSGMFIKEINFGTEEILQVDLSGYSSGIYFLKFYNVNGKYVVRKVIKK